MFTTHSIALTLPIVFLQVCFFPGLIASLYFRLNLNIFNLCPVIILFSLTINYLAVVLLTVMGLLTQPIVLILFLIQLIYLTLRLKTVGFLVKKSINLTFFQFLNLANSSTYSRHFIILFLVFFIPGFLSLILFAYNKEAGLLQIFTAWDAVMSWNKWAVSWSLGQVPQPTFAYPQLFPTNWAISYVLFADSNIESFNVLLMYLFSPLGPIAFGGLALATSSFEILFGSVFSIYLIYFAGSWAGYMDIPVTVAVAILFSTYLTLYYSNQDVKFNSKNLVSIGILCGGMVSVKQSGALAFIVLCILLFCDITRDKNKFPQGLVKSFFCLIFPSILIPGVWYFTKYFFVQDLSDNLIYLTSDQVLHQGLSFHQRIIEAFKNTIFPNKVLVVSIVLALFPRKHQFHQTPIILLTFIFPWLFLWSAFFSYDGRNLVLIYSLLGVIAGSNLFWLTSLLMTKLSLIIPNKIKANIFYLLTIMFAFLYLSFIYIRSIKNYPNNTLQAQNIRMNYLFRGNKELNLKIRSFYMNQGNKKLKFASDDPMFNFIPGLREYHKLYERNPEDGLMDSRVGYIILKIQDCESKSRENLELVFSIPSNTYNFCFFKKINTF